MATSIVVGCPTLDCGRDDVGHVSPVECAWNHIPDATEAVVRIAKVCRWLQNPRSDTQALYAPIISHVRHPWAYRRVTHMLADCFVYGDRLQMQRLSFSPCYRVVPLAWKVGPSKGVVSLNACA
ncbi:MAG: transposase [Chloroflexi bacterium AL-N1]|nr:transposase [Chloroflexi bacterium AL-N1]NOK77388.1 transposase [Chloroflexi bacterium AL-N5]